MKNESSLLHKDFKITLPKINRNWVLLLAPLTAAAWLLVVYAVKGIYPFGNGTVIRYDLYHGGVPAMYYFWDAVHDGNLFYDFATAGGMVRSPVFSFLQLQNVFLLFFERNMIYESISYMLILKLALISFTSSYAFSKIFTKLSAPWVYTISLLNTFSGFVLQYYTNIDWLDIVALYPLIIIFALNMFGGKSKIPYFLTMAYLYIVFTYMSWFVTLSLIIFGGLYIFIVEEKEKRKSDILALGVGTGAALLAGAKSIIGFAKGVLGTVRFNEGPYYLDSISGAQVKTSGLLGILSSDNSVDIVAVFMFLGMSLALTMLIIAAVRSVKLKDYRKPVLFFILSVGLFVLQILIKGTDLIWHTGSYQKFPFRNGFIVPFICCCIIGFYVSSFDKKDGISFKKSKFFDCVLLVPVALAAIITVAFFSAFYAQLGNYDVLNGLTHLQFKIFVFPYFTLVLSCMAMFVLLRLLRFPKIRNLLCCICSLALVFGLSLHFIGLKENSSAAFADYYDDCFDAADNARTESKLDRVNNPDMSLLVNYAYIGGGISSVSNWTHSLSPECIASFENLGFSSDYTMTLDSGGTAFSKALLHITDSVSRHTLCNELYENIKEKDGFIYYKNKYVIPVGTVFDERIAELDAKDFENSFEYQNAIYNCLEEGELFNSLKKNVTVTKTEKDCDKVDELNAARTVVTSGTEWVNSVICTVAVPENSILYLKLNGNEKANSVAVNGDIIPIFNAVYSQENGADNTVYPCEYNNNILELGYFNNENVTVEFEYNEDAEFKNEILLYSMSLDKLGKVCAHGEITSCSVFKDSVTVSGIKAASSGVALLPMSYTDTMSASIDGKNANVVKILGNFSGVEIGNSTKNAEIFLQIESAETIKEWLTILLCFAIGLAFILLEHNSEFLKKESKYYKKLSFFSGFVFVCIFAVGCSLLYIIPLILNIIKLLE